VLVKRVTNPIQEQVHQSILTIKSGEQSFGDDFNLIENGRELRIIFLISCLRCWEIEGMAILK